MLITKTPATETMNIVDSNSNPAPEPIASWGHFIGFLLIMAGTAALGFQAQRAAGASPAGASAGDLASHSKAISVYLVAGIMDWALLYYCWVGVHKRRGNLFSLTGGRWKTWRSLANDIAVTVPFWALWEATAYGVHWILGPSTAKTVDSLLPHSLLEVVLWIAVSITAGFCEEIVFRGYVQRQFHALTANLPVAVIAQALVFGVAHSYQGWKAVVVIVVLGVLYGVLAAWRRNLRVNIVSHAATDIWEGWLKQVIWR